LYFINRRGHTLASVLDLPDNNGSPVFAIFAPCFTCTKDLKAIANIDSSLASAGIAVMRLDFAGLGDSEGDFSESNFSTFIEDIQDAAEYMSGKFAPSEILIGHSFGGCVAIEASHSISSVRAVVTIASPYEPSELSMTLAESRENALNFGYSETEIGGVKFKLKKQFFDDLEKHHLKQFIEGLNKPLLVMHSPADTYGSIDNGLKIFEAAKQPKSFISLDDIDHLMLNKNDARYVGSLIAAWVKKYI
jgi:alpha/beta superfamily hydrolase